MKEEEMLSAEEFFGMDEKNFVVGQNAPGRKECKGGDRLFEETKIRMVMRLHGFSRSKAKALIKDIASRVDDGIAHRDDVEEE